MLEFCRECRDEAHERNGYSQDWNPVPADFILWGKLLPPEALGPKCFYHAQEHLGWSAMYKIEQYAVFDLRKLQKLVDEPDLSHVRCTTCKGKTLEILSHNVNGTEGFRCVNNHIFYIGK